ncbi:MAG: transposase [Hyphomicrobiales bacterium]|nr:transposase [Hyphomicrobiales bacterium]
MDTIGVGDLARKRVRRSWSDEEKRLICSQTRVPGVSVAQVARRYLMNANLIFNWLKDPRFVPDMTAAGETVFLPVEVSTTDMALAPSLPDNRPVQITGNRIEIALSNGHRLTIEGGFDGEALARLLKGLVS